MRTDRVVSTKLAIGADDGGRRRWSRRCIVDISRVELVIRWRRRIRSSSSGCWNWRGHMKLDWIVKQSTTHPPHQLQTLIIQKEKLLTKTASDLCVTHVTMCLALKLFDAKAKTPKEPPWSIVSWLSNELTPTLWLCCRRWVVWQSLRGYKRCFRAITQRNALVSGHNAR